MRCHHLSLHWNSCSSTRGHGRYLSDLPYENEITSFHPKACSECVPPPFQPLARQQPTATTLSPSFWIMMLWKSAVVFNSLRSQALLTQYLTRFCLSFSVLIICTWSMTSRGNMLSQKFSFLPVFALPLYLSLLPDRFLMLLSILSKKSISTDLGGPAH